MNDWRSNEDLELHRMWIEEEVQQIHLEQKAVKSQPSRSNWFGSTMLGFGNWMVNTGKRIRHRYEVPATKCQNSSNHSFAR